MAIDDYAGLKASVQTWAWRDDADFTTRVEDFIAYAESSLSKRLRVREMRKMALISPTSGVFAMPDNVVAIVNLRTQTYPTRALEPIGQDYTDFAVGYRGGGLPMYYNVDGDGLRVFPTSGGPLQITYYERIPALSAAEPTNWLLKKSPELYRNAALLEAALLTQEQDKLPVYGALVDDGISALNSVDVAVSYAGATMRLPMVTP